MIVCIYEYSARNIQGVNRFTLSIQTAEQIDLEEDRDDT